MTLTITPETVQEYFPCNEAQQLIKDAWDKYRKPGVYGNTQYYIGSFWYVEVPEYIDYLVKIGKRDTAEKILIILLDETLSPDDDLSYHIRQEMNKHRLGLYHMTLGEIEKRIEGFFE